MKIFHVVFRGVCYQCPSPRGRWNVATGTIRSGDRIRDLVEERWFSPASATIGKAHVDAFLLVIRRRRRRTVREALATVRRLTREVPGLAETLRRQFA